MKVIIADDSQTMQRILRNMLESIGQTDCLTADGGDIVMELLDRHDDVGLVLLDWNMPVMNGLDCLQAIRGREATKTTPVVMISSEAMRDRVLQVLQAGANGYLIKPFDEPKFQSIISPLLK